MATKHHKPLLSNEESFQSLSSWRMTDDTWRASRRRILDSDQDELKRELVPVEFRSFLRLRPALKKEKDDYVVLEAVQETELDEEHACHTVGLSPMPRGAKTRIDDSCRTKKGDSPLVIHTPDPKNIHALEFRFDRVFHQRSSQENDIFSEIGRPTAFALMDPFMSQDVDHKTYVHIVMGTPSSGKSFTCWGDDGKNLKRKDEFDGMVPRLTDSLFAQYRRLATVNKALTRKHAGFALNISAVQVVQLKNPRRFTEDGSKMYDLFVSSNPRAQTKTESTSPIHEGTGSSGYASSESDPVPERQSNRCSPEGGLYIEQDPMTKDFRIVNAQTRSCTSADEAREALQDALTQSRKRNSKRNQSHIYMQIQPLTINRKTGQILRKGSTMIIVDMAGVNDINPSSARHRSGWGRNKDNISDRCDAHTAVLRCLNTIVCNEQIRQGNLPVHRDERGDAEIETDGRKLGLHIKKVPYLQHKLTMMLQPFFSIRNSDRTMVTLIATASQGHRDYAEKKELLNELDSLWASVNRAAEVVVTGSGSDGACGTRNRPRRDNQSEMICDADDEASAHRNRHKRPSGQKQKEKSEHSKRKKLLEHSLTYSDSSQDDNYVMPPPVAPPLPPVLPHPRHLMSPCASAPDEEEFKKIHITMEYTPPSKRVDYTSTRADRPCRAEADAMEVELDQNKSSKRRNIAKHHRDRSPLHPQSRSPLQPPSRSPLLPSTRSPLQPSSENNNRTVDGSSDKKGRLSKSAMETLNARLCELKEENSSLREEVRDLRRENEDLQRQLQEMSNRRNRVTNTIVDNSDNQDDISTTETNQAHLQTSDRLMNNPLFKQIVQLSSRY